MVHSSPLRLIAAPALCCLFSCLVSACLDNETGLGPKDNPGPDTTRADTAKPLDSTKHRDTVRCSETPRIPDPSRIGDFAPIAVGNNWIYRYAIHSVHPGLADAYDTVIHSIRILTLKRECESSVFTYSDSVPGATVRIMDAVMRGDSILPGSLGYAYAQEVNAPWHSFHTLAKSLVNAVEWHGRPHLKGEVERGDYWGNSGTAALVDGVGMIEADLTHRYGMLILGTTYTTITLLDFIPGTP
jgi:hypothetical protein